MVDERAVLFPFQYLINGAKMDSIIELPMLLPRWKTHDRHFAKVSALLLSMTHRYYRQRHHATISEIGSLRVK
jgi:hypothetical protein